MKCRLPVWPFFFFVWAGCATQRQDPPAAYRSVPRILFLAYELNRDSAGDAVTARLVHQTVAEGSVEDPASGEDSHSGFIEIRFLDEKNAVLKRFLIANPLDREYEAVDDHGEFIRVRHAGNRGELLLRSNHDPRAVKVTLSMEGKDGAHILLTHSLNQ